MTRETTCQVLVVGGGPGGYVAAIRAAQLGLGVILVEAGELGGTCLNRGCIPSKALLNASARFQAMRDCADAPVMGLRCTAPGVDMAELADWKSHVVGRLRGGVGALLAANKVRVVAGWATFRNAKICDVSTAQGQETIHAGNVILAAGSIPSGLPGAALDGNVLSSTEALDLEELPASLLVVGAGYIGLELATVFTRLGSQVSIVEAGDRILPGFAPALSKPVADWFERHGVTIALSSRVERVHGTAAGCEVEVRNPDGALTRTAASKVLVAIGRAPNTAGWGLENMGVDMTGAFIKVDAQCRTSMRGVWAVGDLVGEPMLAHKAMAQGEMVAEIIAGMRRKFESHAIPAVCFTEPEIVSVGRAAADAGHLGFELVSSRFPFAANGRSLSGNSDVGFIEVVARKTDNVVVGIHAVGQHIGELAGEFSLAVEMEARLEDIAATIHAHPTLGEGFFEASLQGLGRSLHLG